jgi:hypothetical protein
MVQKHIWKPDCHSDYQKYYALFMEPEGSSPRSQKLPTVPYPEPAESIPISPRSSLMYPPTYA